MSRIERIIARSSAALATRVLARHKRNADMELYRVLADCMEIAEICLADIGEYEILNGLISDLPMIEGKDRQYVERGSDIYQRVCRFVFHGEEHTANTNRYAHALREAARVGVVSKKLLSELCNGGINKFFLTRPSQSQERMVATKCLRLDKQITHSRSDTITLRLKRGMENIYTVLEFDDGAAMQPRSRPRSRRN